MGRSKRVIHFNNMVLSLMKNDALDVKLADVLEMITCS